VLVHSGTANHGHYYSYIKSFEDNRWYCFNDERVYEVGVAEVEKTFGGGAIFANAYALSYRVVEK
jgi:ubiquitin C-terminal hydrolase